MKNISYTTMMVCGILIFALIAVASCTQREDPVEPETSDPKVKQIVIQAGQMDGSDNVVRLKYLASGVGWDFSPNARTSTELKRIGIKTIRCINIDPLPGEFAPDGTFVMGVPTNLLQHLKTCRDIGATPHLCIAINLPVSIRATEEDIPEDQHGLLGNEMKKNVYGPTDWIKFRNHYKVLFKYILVDQGFLEE